MEKNKIQQLLEKYFEGNTTLEDEKILHDFFSSSGHVDPEMSTLRRQFQAINEGRNFPAKPVNLEWKILESIKDYEQAQKPPEKKSYLIHYLVAASIALAVVLSGVFFLRSQRNEISDTYTDPQLAYAETQKTLLFISQKMNEGMKPLDNISKMNTGTNQLKNLEKMDKSLGMLNLVSFINQSSNMKK